MAKNKPAEEGGVPKHIKEQEGRALKALWKAHAKRSQAAFASEHGFTQGNFSHYVGGRQPIPLEIGVALAKELGVDLAAISPRLAAELEAERQREARIWPFPAIDRRLLRDLSQAQMLILQGVILQEIERLRASQGNAKPTKEGPQKNIKDSGECPIESDVTLPASLQRR